MTTDISSDLEDATQRNAFTGVMGTYSLVVFGMGNFFFFRLSFSSSVIFFSLFLRFLIFIPLFIFFFYAE